VAGLVPWWISRWQVQPPLLAVPGLGWVGGLLIVAGVPMLLDSFARFAIHGWGTPAPVLPTRRLVVTGFYRYVRNPMYVGVAALIFGQGFLFRNLRVLGYGVVVWLAFHAFILAYEEPTLRRRFGEPYENVPRWLPRLKPWNG
jgi:protein-S-isoprenylcysteine O-methyltransferase Ste14